MTAIAVLALLSALATGPAATETGPDAPPGAPGAEAWPRTVDEAVHRIMSTWLSPADEDRLLRAPESVRFELHHGFGTRVRNEFGLWRGNLALLESCAKRHPDDCSDAIIGALLHSIRADADRELAKALDAQRSLVAELVVYRLVRTGALPVVRVSNAIRVPATHIEKS